MRNFVIGILLCWVTNAWATHNRSGNITYRYLYGNTYEFTIMTCTKLSAEADRPELEISYGDGQSDTLERISETPNTTLDTKINIYKGVHSYTGAGTFIIQMQDPNRNSGILNISNSVQQVFCIQTILVISPFIGAPNNSAIMEECPCPELACLNKPWVYNVSAYDPDGDSLSYALIPCKGNDCVDMTIPAVYQYPQNVGGGTLTINPITGTLIWNSPGLIGEYNLAIIVYEYRHGIIVGSIIRDMQLTVQACSNEPPHINTFPASSCVQAGQHIQQTITATDPDTSNVLSFDVYGQPYVLTSNPATFTSSPSVSPLNGIFDWTPDCAAIRSNPYNLTFDVSDNAGSFFLKDIFVWNITVNAPSVQNLQVAPSGNTMQLSWSPYPCNGVKQYNVYRTTDSASVGTSSCCFNGQANELGYSLIGHTTNINDTTYSDANVIIGNQYCYIVTVVLDNGTESCISTQACGELNFSIPVLTNITIETTASIGSDTVRWQHPTELDSVQYPGPYQYKLYRISGVATPLSLVFTSNMDAILKNCDTLFHDTSIDSQDSLYSYRVELWSNGINTGSSSTSESIFLSLTPNDNQLGLSWTTGTTWALDSFQVYRETTAGSGIFNPIAWVYTNSYTDVGLTNGITYCYKIKSFGHYSLPEIHTPLINWSQIACGIPFDHTPPCPPLLSIEQDCDLDNNTLTWNDLNHSCADDVTRYYIYFSQYDDSNYTKVGELTSSSDTIYIHSTEKGVSGCYYVTALDSIQYNNESQPSNKVCVDNCPPIYQLPNIITPNGDGENDLFHPLLPMKNISRVECSIFNRWGEVLFETQDPLINWDGIESKKGRKVTEGVYFYLCKVYYLTLAGEKSFLLNGFFHVVYK